MKQKMNILPVKCKKCGGVFDLWFDLNKREKFRRALSEGEKLDYSLFSESLCWNCRKKIFEKIEKNSRKQEYEMFIELE